MTERIDGAECGQAPIGGDGNVAGSHCLCDPAIPQRNVKLRFGTVIALDAR